MSLIAEDRQSQAREKEHSKHSSRKRHSGVTEAAAPVICCPDMKALLVAPAVFRKPVLNSSLQGQLCSRHTGLLFLEHTKLTSTTGLLHLLCSSSGNAFPSELVRDGPSYSCLTSNVECSERPFLMTCSKEENILGLQLLLSSGFYS